MRAVLGGRKWEKGKGGGLLCVIDFAPVIFLAQEGKEKEGGDGEGGDP